MLVALLTGLARRQTEASGWVGMTMQRPTSGGSTTTPSAFQAMTVHKPKLRKTAAVFASVVLSASILSGCTIVDGSLKYVVEGTAVDGAGEPVAGAKVAVTTRQGFDPSVERPDWPGFALTEKNGSFTASTYDGSWGYSLLFGFIPIGSTTPPIPPTIDRVYLHYQRDKASAWQQVALPVDVSAQGEAEPGQRRVQVGTVKLGADSGP